MSVRQTDIAIVGGGLSGSTAAAMLVRAGFDVTLIDLHAVYPPDFRCEKLDRHQVEVLKKTGLADTVLKQTTPDQSLWVSRLGHLVEKLAGGQYGFFYETLVNTIRAEVPAASLIAGKVTSIVTSDDRQTIMLSGGETISARLVVLANGLNVGLRQNLGIERKVISESHSVTIGFNLRPVGRTEFDFSALTCHSEHPDTRVAYLTLFPIGAITRANLFVYRTLHDPWLKQFRDAPRQTLLEILPGLERVAGPFEVDGFVKIRPVDLCVTEGHRQAGLVMIGDAFATSCPAAGTGAGRAIHDAERLCNVHIPRWLASPGMGVEKIAAFYDDADKKACDEHSLAKAFSLRELSLATGVRWQVMRLVKFALQRCRGWVRQLAADPQAPTPHATGEGAGPLNPSAPARMSRTL